MPQATLFRRALLANIALSLSLSLSLAMLSQSPAQSENATVIRIWGHGHKGQDYILTLLRAWQDGFQKLHPGVRFDDELDGDASAMGGLYTDTADLAILDREASFIEIDAYQQGTGYDPFRIPVASGSVAIPHHAPALVVYVNRANPLTHLTIQQLDGIFDADHRLSPKSYKTWGDLGLTGEWAAKPIQLYTYTIQSAEVQFFERAALKGSQKFSCCLTLFQSKSGATAEQQIADAVSRDKYALAVSSEAAANLKPIALSADGNTTAVLPTVDSITAGGYPLARTVYLYAKRKPGQALPLELAAFLQYIVSPEGQAIVARTGGYLPLSPELVSKARETLQ